MARKATPQEQKHYKTMVTQMLQFITNPQTSGVLYQSAQSQGPVKAIVDLIKQAITGVGQAASMAKVQLADHTAMNAAKEVAMILVGLLAQGGLIKEDPKAVMQQIMQELMAGGQQAPQQEQPAAQPQQPMPQQGLLGA